MKSNPITGRPVEKLLVEDNPGDVRLMVEALQQSKIPNNVSVVEDGVEAIAFLRREGKYVDAPRPDLIMLDLNLPKKHGREVLAEIKSHDNLKRIPVIVLTISEEEEDILEAYGLSANCHVTKPVNFRQFAKVVRAIEDFWLTIVRLPSE